MATTMPQAQAQQPPPHFPPPPGAPPSTLYQPNAQRSPSFPPPSFSYPPPPRAQTSSSLSEKTSIAGAYAANVGINNAPQAAPSYTAQPETPSSEPPPSVVETERAAGGPLHLNQLLSSSTADEVGTFNGGSYRISHRDTNSVLTLQLAMGCPIEARPGAMIAMSELVTLRGSMRFSLKKVLAGGKLSLSTYTGPGEVLLAPSTLGDIMVLRLAGSDSWKCGRDVFLASTSGIKKEYQTQSLTKGMFSGEGFFIYKMEGVGLIWIQSFGAIIQKDIPEGESYLVDNGHLVAWNCKYKIERVASGGIISGLAAGEGLACRFAGPGTVYLQTRNVNAFAAQIGASTASG
ncbi:DUF124-domain-containing protein [Aspergillus uvarum CBS 121591]|uniref:Altered inheritance of mitochondria protein 24, mitochondrial n=1 Tax=Aspergillus uvarum CBS 121591 TaxID=1448315 RepID=A0A319C760_9EURO|nr:DUF124-domain-containing protein [Aspergillus uvarum CBS 121591]PYH79727.1 DUF124-domain-containing protein [Aspergillus uvarum CBS 121591]